jgi:hypothetical protein
MQKPTRSEPLAIASEPVGGSQNQAAAAAVIATHSRPGPRPPNQVASSADAKNVM